MHINNACVPINIFRIFFGAAPFEIISKNVEFSQVGGKQCGFPAKLQIFHIFSPMCMIAARKIINVIFRVENRPPFTIYLQKTYKKSEVDVELSTSSTSYDVCTANIFAQLYLLHTLLSSYIIIYALDE